MRAAVAAALVCITGGCGVDAFGARASELGVLPQSAKIQGRDGGPSGVVWGRSVWSFGDTVLDVADAEGSNWHHNSYSITSTLTVAGAAPWIDGFSEPSDGAGAPRYFLAPTADEAAFNAAHRGDACSTAPCGARWAVWPGPPIWDAARSRALIFYGLIYAEPGDFNFHGVGQSVATWSELAADPERPVLTPGAEHATLLFGADEPAWGTAALVDGDQLYVFACDSDKDGLAPPCYLARVAPGSVLDRGAWQYFGGDGWSAAPGDRRALFVGAPGLTVARSAHLGRWAAIYAQPLTNHVVIRTADALTGPWSDPRLLFEASRDPAGAYDAHWHPEYDDGNVLYVTFSRPNGKGWFGSEFALERVALP
jgi:hypothetical protein